MKALPDSLGGKIVSFLEIITVVTVVILLFPFAWVYSKVID